MEQKTSIKKRVKQLKVLDPKIAQNLCRYHTHTHTFSHTHHTHTLTYTHKQGGRGDVAHDKEPIAENTQGVN